MASMLKKALKFVRYRSLGRSLRSRPLAQRCMYKEG